MSSYQHTCIKPGCGMTYSDSDPDAYYCVDCNKARKAIADKVNAKLAHKPKRPVMNELQEFDAIAKSKGVRFVNIKDLGIKI